MGPSGSGEQMRQEGLSFVDGLIYGRRRWLFIDPVPFNALRESAREVLEPAFLRDDLYILHDQNLISG
jgi:hypothetical protein